MTCIVGLAHEGKVYIGADSAGVGGLNLTVRADRKVFKNGEFLIGFTSSFRMGQLLQHDFSPPRRHADQDVFAFMVKAFIKEVRDCFKSGGFAERRSEAESGGTFLVGYEGRIFQVDDDYQVGENVEPYAACGCGSQIALGALYATSDLKEVMSPGERVMLALKAAEAFSAGVRAPFHIETIG